MTLNEYEGQRGPVVTPPKGSQEWYEQQQGGGGTPSTDAPKGSKEWSEQVNAAPAAPAVPSTAVPSEAKVSTDAEAPGATTSTDTDNPPVASAQQQGGTAVPADTSGSDRKIKTLQDMIDTLEPPETAEQRKKRERREKSAKIISAVSDGLMAMSNLYFTSQYAPNMYNHEKGSQLNAQNAAIERARKDREANADKYLRFALALGDAENERAKTAREIEAEQERRKLAREKAQRDAEAHGWKAALQPDVQREQAGKADTAEQKARTAQAEADNAPALQQAKLETEKARKGSYQASAANSRASAAAHGRSNQQVVHHFNGKTYPKGSNDYEKEVREAARQYNQRHGKWVDDVDTDGKKIRKWVYDEGFQPIITDRTHDGKVTARKAEEYAGEVETALAKEREDNTPPTKRKKNNDNTPPSRR